MGKAAKNEQLKLKATFYNNLGVGLVITGIVVPYIAFSPRARELDDLTLAIWRGTVDYENIKYQFITPALASLTAFIAAVTMRLQADRTLNKLQD